MSNKKLYIIIGIVLYIVSAGISYFTFSKTQKSGKSSNALTSSLPKDSSGKTAFDDALPRTEACPITGELFSKQQREWWERHRPMGIMIENHEDSRPQSGISSADIVYEAVAEGGITRFLAIFYCQDAGMIGPIRSARTYYIDFLSEYGDKPLYVHVGGANRDGPADALEQLIDYGWQLKNNINLTFDAGTGFPVAWRDYERLGHVVATEHTMYSTAEKLWKFAADRRKLGEVDDKGVPWNKSFIPWQVKDDARQADRGNTSPTFGFWAGYDLYNVKWVFDMASNSYKRENGGKPHLDKDNDRQVSAKNVVVVFMVERSLADEEKHLLYKTLGKGKALFFFDGKVVEGTWEKKDRVSRMGFFDAKGKPIQLNKGQIWIEVLPVGNQVTY